MADKIDIYLPTLHAFAMNNPYTGSCGALRFKIVPKVKKKEGSKEVDMDASSIEAEFWHGELCYEKSTMEAKQVFPMSEEGRLSIKAWLEENV